jgi:hypothetical protein
MKNSTLSMLVFASYLAVLGILFAIIPNTVITLFGFDPVTDVWIRIMGMILVILAYYYSMAIKEQATNFYRWTAYGRFPIFFVLLAFVLLDLAPPILILFGAFDTSCAIWTGLALKREAANRTPITRANRS